jgi:hypothetical protein
LISLLIEFESESKKLENNYKYKNLSPNLIPSATIKHKFALFQRFCETSTIFETKTFLEFSIYYLTQHHPQNIATSLEGKFMPQEHHAMYQENILRTRLQGERIKHVQKKMK